MVPHALIIKRTWLTFLSICKALTILYFIINVPGPSFSEPQVMSTCKGFSVRSCSCSCQIILLLYHPLIPPSRFLSSLPTSPATTLTPSTHHSLGRSLQQVAAARWRMQDLIKNWYLYSDSAGGCDVLYLNETSSSSVPPFLSFQSLTVLNQD